MLENSPQTVNRLAKRDAETFFGRKTELAALFETLTPNGPLVTFLHGIPGQGKSTLLSHFSQKAIQQGAQVQIMDCSQVEPTTQGFMNQWGDLLDTTLKNAQAAAAELQNDHRLHILCLDHYEAFLLLDSWLRQNLMPLMPDNFRLIMASRRPPVPRWLTSPGWHGLFRVIALPALDQESACKLLRQGNVPPSQCDAITSRTHGNPLALKLAAAANLSHTSTTHKAAALEEVMQELTRIFLSEVSSPATRDALEKSSVARRITQALLRSLPGVDEAQFQELRQLPFVETRADGLRLHDSVREAIASTLRATDPERYFAARRNAWAHLRAGMHTSPQSELWRTTADMLFLIENKVIREAFFPSGNQELAVEKAQPSDWMQIRNLIRRHDGDGAVTAFTSWWEHLPEAFFVVRNTDDQIIAFYCMAETADLDPAILEADPVASIWQRHVDDSGLKSSEQTLFLRRWLTLDEGEGPSAAQASCWLDAKRIYMELRPDLRRVYLTVVDLPVYGPVATKLGFHHLPDCTVTLGQHTCQTAMLDFGPESVDGWITNLVGDEMGIHETSPLDQKRRTLMLQGVEINLTPLEFQLATFLESRAGQTLSRYDILTEVWGHVDETASSNVVDAVVKSLRRKLGDSAQMLETVRGFGYRWQKT